MAEDRRRDRLQPLPPRHAEGLFVSHGFLLLVGKTLMIRDWQSGRLLSVDDALRSQFVGRNISIVVTPFIPPSEET